MSIKPFLALRAAKAAGISLTRKEFDFQISSLDTATVDETRYDDVLWVYAQSIAFSETFNKIVICGLKLLRSDDQLAINKVGKLFNILSFLLICLLDDAELSDLGWYAECFFFSG